MTPAPVSKAATAATDAAVSAMTEARADDWRDLLARAEEWLGREATMADLKDLPEGF
jgi:hypothetical protein